MSFQPNNPYLQKGIAQYSAAQKNDSNLRKGIVVYGQLLDNLELAKKAIEEDRMQDRSRHLKEAENTIIKLQSFLDFDSKEEVVLIFNNLYNSIIQALHEIIAFNKSAEELMGITKEVRKLKEEFEKIDQEEAKLHAIEDSKHLEC